MKRLTIEVLFDIADLVILKTKEDLVWQVMAYSVRENETVYELFNFDEGNYTAYDYEIIKVV